MAWYDVFSAFYDASLERHYREQRVQATAALDLQPGSVVLDLPCGTGQSLPGLCAGVGPSGRVLGVDLSAGMLRQAQRRVERGGLTGVTLARADAATLDLSALGGAPPNRLHIFLGMSVFPNPAATFEHLWSLLAPGGRCVIMDCHAETLTFQGRMVNLLAGADIRRRSWAPLEAVGVAFERRALPSLPLHGGQLFLATALKP
jgi:demethylmenaquinone methyltransferase/2-methoxy-6-polyprenyl-1,4-benzoquinol methylase